MSNPLIEELLNEAEGSALDFKRDQYDFVAATDDKKGELLKDILAFANAWRRQDAFIVIGVAEVLGGRSTPIGVQDHLKDADLQQFVNSKTQRPVSFSYRAEGVDGVEIGIIHIPIQQRPFFLREDYGRLKKHAVYLRRGSSTSIADPDEIARMGATPHSAVAPVLLVQGTVISADKGEFLVSVVNSGPSVARAPYLELEPPGPFMISQYGLDGSLEARHGLPLLPRQGGRRPNKFAGNTDVVLHPGTTREITVVDWRGERGKVPAVVSVPYRVAAEGFPAVDGELRVVFRHEVD